MIKHSDLQKPIFTTEEDNKKYILQLSNKSAGASHSYLLSATAMKLFFYALWNVQYLANKLWIDPKTKKVDEKIVKNIFESSGLTTSEDIAKRQLNIDNSNLYVKDMYKMFNISRTNGYNAIKNASKELTNLQLRIEMDDKEKFIYMNIFPTIICENGTFRFTINRDFIPHIINLNKNYILSDLEIINKFKKTYSIIFYHYFKSKVYSGKVIKINWDINSIYLQLNISSKSAYFHNYGLFKSKILLPTINEINYHSNLKIKYLGDVRGGKNKVIKVKFQISNYETPIFIKMNKNIKKNSDLVKYYGCNDNIKKDDKYYSDRLYMILCSCENTKSTSQNVDKLTDMFCKNCNGYGIAYNEKYNGFINDKVKYMIDIEMNKKK